MAVINKYPSDLGPVSETDNKTKWSLQDGDKPLNFDLNTASPRELEIFKIALGVGEVLYKLKNGILIQANPYEGDSKNYNTNSYPSNYENNGNQNINSSKGQTQSKQITKLPPGVKPGTFSNSSDLTNQYPTNMGGFTDRLLISLLAGFGLGVIAAATYICINLSKTTIYLQ